MVPLLDPDPYILVLTGVGFLIALVAWLPLALRRLPLSLPIVCIGLGAAFFLLPGARLVPSPLDYPEFTERFSEFVVIIALMGAGLKLDRPFGWRRWEVSWRLILVTLPLSIAAITLLAGSNTLREHRSAASLVALAPRRSARASEAATSNASAGRAGSE